jgi:O-succinylbenzoic acid--CoA ligase
MSFGLALLSRASITPRAPAIEGEDSTWTFAELAERARRGAAYIAASAPPTAAPVAMLLPGDARFVAWLAALSLAGRAAMPLNTRLTTAELAQQLAAARADLLLGERGDPRLAELAARLPGLDVVAVPQFAVLPDARGHMPGEEAADDALLVVLFTSGTSGRSKGACLTWSNFAASALAAADPLGPAIAERWLACMPLFHVGGLSIVVRSVLFGGPIRLHSRFDAALVSDALDAGDIAGVSLVPTMLARLLDHRGARPAPAGLEVLLLGGAAASPELLARARFAGYPVCPTYGLTEATSQVATARPQRPGAARPAPMLPLPGVVVRIVAEGEDAAAGEPGEIVVGGPTVMQGYLDDPAATALALRDGWLHTGDIGFVDDAGGLHVLDRRDDLIVSGGENVYPAEVEAVLVGHPSVAEAGVAGVPDADLGSRVVAWIVANDAATLDSRALAEFCRTHLAGFKLPREFRFVSALPRTAAGKLQRRRLADLPPT